MNQDVIDQDFAQTRAQEDRPLPEKISPILTMGGLAQRLGHL